MHTPKSREQALRMLDTFASVGANRFDASRIDMDRKIIAARPDTSIAELKRILPAALASAAHEQHNLVIRPRGAVPLVQLDDLSAKDLHHIAPVAFMIVETSPNNHQCWVAVDSATPDTARRLRKGAGADLNASGSVRLAGSRNFKLKYAPDFPTVTLVDTAPGRIVSAADIAPFLAPEEPRTWVQRVGASRPRRWPDYQRIIAGAPANNEGAGPDVSRADYLYARVSAQWGWNTEEITAQLLELSPKAQQAGERYARRTTEAAIKSNLATTLT